MENLVAAARIRGCFAALAIALITLSLWAAGAGAQPEPNAAPSTPTQVAPDTAIRVRDRHGFEAWYEPGSDGTYIYSTKRNETGVEGYLDLLAQLSGLFLFGLVGQLMFSARFIVQWIASEKAGRSVVPHSFWWLSVAGTVTLLIYFAIRHEPIGMLGQACGLPIYLRNLVLLGRARSQQSGLEP